MVGLVPEVMYENVETHTHAHIDAQIGIATIVHTWQTCVHAQVGCAQACMHSTHEPPSHIINMHISRQHTHTHTHTHTHVRARKLAKQMHTLT